MIIDSHLIKGPLSLALPPIQWIPWLALLFTMSISASQRLLPEWAHYVPFLASIIFFGLPHGAVDHLIPFWMNRERLNSRKLIGFILLYLLLSSLYLLWWATAPTVAFFFFIGMTWFHWGQGDLYALVGSLHMKHLDRPLLRAATLFVRGGLPMFIPLLAYPEVYRAVAVDTIGLFAYGGVSQFDWVFGAEMLWAGGMLYGFLILATFVWTWFTTDAQYRPSWWLDLWETSLLISFFWLVPPLLAIGTYFCLWHSIRHISRIQSIKHEVEPPRSYGETWRFWREFFRDAAPLTTVALLLLGLFYFAVPQTPQTLNAYLGLYLAFIGAVTFPHTVLVTWLDFRQGLWQPKVS